MGKSPFHDSKPTQYPVGRRFVRSLFLAYLNIVGRHFATHLSRL
jgi:hypothetical protein